MLRPLRYYYCDVSGSNWFHLFQSSWPELVRRCMHKGLELFYYLNLKDRTPPYSRTLCRALPCPHFLLKGKKKCLHLLPTVFLRNYTEQVDPPIPFVLATSPKVSSPRAPRRRQRKQPVCCGGAAFFLSQ
ncbi:unnamed protein product [Cuscuta epithymum]|uniref:Uncharacterized protein n=1 Tax=Cuscuta epithymum TaxID=186058 RepID=A0AAV0E9F1_9ASTE|nr:unnamed protein product [Cuscuta epithymum]